MIKKYAIFLSLLNVIFGQISMSDINKLSNDELKNKMNLLKKDLFNFRFRKVNSQLEDTAKISLLKKDIAKIYTKLNKKDK